MTSLPSSSTFVRSLSWASPNIILLIAAVLDPSSFLKFYFYTVGGNVEDKMRELRQHLNKYYLEYEKVVRVHSLPVFLPSDEYSSSQGTSESSASSSGKSRIEFAFAQFASQNSRARTERSELDIYLEDTRVFVRPDEQFNVLAWRKKNSDVFPILSLMARDFLAIPVSTVSSESAFSAARRILGKNRTSLAPETLEALICVKDWLFGFNDEDEGEPLTGQRMFTSDDEED